MFVLAMPLILLVTESSEYTAFNALPIASIKALRVRATARRTNPFTFQITVLG